MFGQTILRGMLVAAAAVGAFAWSSHDASAAEHLLLNQGTWSGSCQDSRGYYFTEAWGYANGQIVCETSQIAISTSISGTECSNAFLGKATTQTAVITIRDRNTNYGYVATLAQSSQTPWGQLASVGYVVANGSGCTGGTIDSYSLGKDN